jgi:predicted transposase/invertase (TIGR01784 family)
MAKRPPNIHDTFVRESFSDPERAAAVFEKFLPPNLAEHLDFGTLSVLKETYINETLNEHFSDLVFEVSLKNDISVKTDVVLLFEHKSSPDRNVLFQVGHYMFAQWVKCLSENKQPKPIIPVIYYQGKKNWIIGNLSDLFKKYPTEITDYLPIFKHIFIDLKTISQDQLLGMRNSMMTAAMLAQQWRIDPVKLKEDFERIYRIFQLDSSNTNFLEMIVVLLVPVFSGFVTGVRHSGSPTSRSHQINSGNHKRKYHVNLHHAYRERGTDRYTERKSRGKDRICSHPF